MKSMLRRLFSPILNVFEKEEDVVNYKPSHRVILIVIGILFGSLSAGVLWLAQGADVGYLLPVVVFACISFVCLVVGLLGKDSAVSRIWSAVRQ